MYLENVLLNIAAGFELCSTDDIKQLCQKYKNVRSHLYSCFKASFKNHKTKFTVENFFENPYIHHGDWIFRFGFSGSWVGYPRTWDLQPF